MCSKSSGGVFDVCRPMRECLDRVVGLTSLQTVVQHAEVSVGEIARGGGMTVAAVASAVMMLSGLD
jgi:hypothetical protein